MYKATSPAPRSVCAAWTRDCWRYSEPSGSGRTPETNRALRTVAPSTMSCFRVAHPVFKSATKLRGKIWRTTVRPSSLYSCEWTAWSGAASQRNGIDNLIALGELVSLSRDLVARHLGRGWRGEREGEKNTIRKAPMRGW
jgi:hypothetical protein